MLLAPPLHQQMVDWILLLNLVREFPPTPHLHPATLLVRAWLSEQNAVWSLIMKRYSIKIELALFLAAPKPSLILCTTHNCIEHTSVSKKQLQQNVAWPVFGVSRKQNKNLTLKAWTTLLFQKSLFNWRWFHYSYNLLFGSELIIVHLFVYSIFLHENNFLLSQSSFLGHCYIFSIFSLLLQYNFVSRPTISLS